jgi:TonB family protein
LLTKRTDPRFGVQTVRVTELARQEPEASLFAVSGDYKVVDETVPGQQGGIAVSNGGSLAAPPLPPGVFRAGVNGTTVPVCVYCPIPGYTDQARAAKANGTVVLQVVVTADGHAENISVIRGPGLGLEQTAIDAVRKWRFKPAHGADGNPVATVVPVEVTFRIR